MSGRDFKAFLATHQYQIGRSNPRLLSHFLSGHGHAPYKPVDYEQVRALTRLKQSAGKRVLKKLEGIEQKSSESKERQLMADHRAVWLGELRHLKRMQSSIEDELQSLISAPSLQTMGYTFEITSCGEALADACAEFERNTVTPLRDLREDVIFWLKENREALHMGTAYDDHSKVSQVVASVKKQQSEIWTMLEAEIQACEDELTVSAQKLGINQVEFKLPVIETGIPQEADDLHCLDEELRKLTLQEFHRLDHTYAAQLRLLEEQHKDTIERYPSGGWSVEDHDRFKYVQQQYAMISKPNRRELYLDRLSKELPQFSRKEQVQHDLWWHDCKAFFSHMRALISAWQRDRDDLFLRLGSLFVECNDRLARQVETFAARRQQEGVCRLLHEKLDQYHAQRAEAMRLEASLKAVEEEIERQRREQELKLEGKKRAKIKKKLDAYHQEQQRKQDQQRTEEEQRLRDLQGQINEQRQRDLERVKFRENEYEKKQEELKKLKEEQEEEEAMREQRLNRLRAQVQVEVESDPARLLQPTQASLARAAAQEETEKELMEPLFPLYTFNVQQIGNDKRVRLEGALRALGLHQTAYARHVLSTVAPPTRPRKDMESTLAWQKP